MPTKHECRPQKRARLGDQRIEEENSPPEEELQDVFRKYFEAQFKPLQIKKKVLQRKVEVDQATAEDEGSEWSGFSESEDEKQVDIVDFTGTLKTNKTSREERKAFMTSKPPTVPTDYDNKAGQPHKPREPDANDKDEIEHLKNDLALQRLLQESHLLELGSSLSPSGDKRHRAIDLRLQQLGAKDSVFRERSMPMSVRKGVMAKAKERETTRRKEARENGIILERPKPTKTLTSRKRERGVGNPAVGRFKKGMLTLSKRDVADITGGRT